MHEIYYWTGAIVFWSVFPLALSLILLGLSYLALNLIYRNGKHAGRFLLYLIHRGYQRDDGGLSKLAVEWDKTRTGPKRL